MASRSGFSSRLGFVAAAAGSAVGLGNIWSFPYQTGANGGAAFLFIYLAFIFLIGFPIMVGEIAIGRRTLLNPYGAYKKLGGRSWAWLGFFGVLCGVMILSFYNVVAGWAFGYFVQIAFGDLLSLGSPEAYGNFFSTYTSNVGNNMGFSLMFMVITAFIVARGVQNGIETAAKILMPVLFLILFGLIIYALTLPNAMDGVRFYLQPDFSKITVKTMYAALGQAFFSLSLGMGALITYGSYIGKKENIVSAGFIVTLADTSVAFLAGLMILPLVFSQGIEASGGPGLVFMTLPGVFENMGGMTGTIIGGAFFLLLSVAALTSTVSLLEVPVSYLVDDKKWGRVKSTLIMALIVFLFGLPSLLSQGAVSWLTELTFLCFDGSYPTFLDLIQAAFLEVGLPFGGFMMSLFISQKWKTSNLAEEIQEGFPNYPGSFIEKFLNFMLTWVCPIVLGIMVIITVLQKFFQIVIIG
ncbi:MAG: sodium-dependent transporter [Bacteroidota bacterium]